MEDKVIELLKEDCRNHGACVGGNCAKECRRFNDVASSIREALAQELEKLKKGCKEIYLMGDENTIQHDEIIYNQAITDCQAKLREGGKG